MVDINNPPVVARHLDLMVLGAQTTAADIERACEQATILQAAAVCVPGVWVSTARARLEDSMVKVCALVSYPWGLNTADVKRYEIEAALDEGAQEFEVMCNHALLQAQEGRLFQREVRDVVEAAEEHPVKLVVKPECFSSEDLKRIATWCVNGEAHCMVLAPEVETGQNWPEEIRRLNAPFSDSLFFKVCLPVSDRSIVTDLLAAGAMRVGICFHTLS